MWSPQGLETREPLNKASFLAVWKEKSAGGNDCGGDRVVLKWTGSPLLTICIMGYTPLYQTDSHEWRNFNFFISRPRNPARILASTMILWAKECENWLFPPLLTLVCVALRSVLTLSPKNDNWIRVRSCGILYRMRNVESVRVFSPVFSEDWSFHDGRAYKFHGIFSRESILTLAEEKA